MRDVIITVPVLIATRVVGIAALAAAAVSSRPAFAWIAFVAVIILDTVARSLGGFSNHARAVPLLTLAIVAWQGPTRGGRDDCITPSSCGHVSHTATNQHMNWGGGNHEGVLWVLALAVVLPYMYIGCERLFVGGLGMFTGDVLIQYLSAASRSFQSYPAWLDPAPIRPILNIGFLLTTLMELTAPALLFIVRYRAWWLAGMILFQASTLLLMNVFFWENLLLTMVLFWPSWEPAASE